MAKRVTEIMPVKARGRQKDEPIRVGAYCRVSTNMHHQELSYESQLRYYQDLISRKPSWKLVQVYADKGISGTKTEKRTGFLKMMEDCEKGKIDKIITKSISRFARNTVDCISNIRKLKLLGVAVYFEKENIDTMTMQGELMLSILSSIAQAEAEAVSTNAQWAVQYRFQNGIFKQFTGLGYRYDETGELAIQPEEAKVVRLIFESYLEGKGMSTIAEEMNEKGYCGRNGEPFKVGGIGYILKNPLYKGELLYQKTYRTEFPERKQKWNHGEVIQYLVENSHKPIVTAEEFQATQRIMGYRNQNMSQENLNRYGFSGKIECGKCGGVFHRRISYAKEVQWVCVNHIEKKGCSQPFGGRIKEKHIKNAFVDMCNKLKYNSGVLERILERLEQAEDALACHFDEKLNSITEQIEQLEKQNQILSQMIVDGYLDPAFFIQEKSGLDLQLDKLREEKDQLQSEESFQECKRNTQRIIQSLNRREEWIETFDERLFDEIVEKVIVQSQTEIEFKLINGLKLKERIEVLR